MSADLKVKKLFEDAKLPVREHPTDSGADIFVYRFEKIFSTNRRESEKEILSTVDTLLLQPNERVLINTGISATVGISAVSGIGYEIQVRPRSGNALKKGLTILNTPGTIDESYRGMVGVIIINLDLEPQIIKVGDKIAQLVVCPVIYSPIVEVEDLDKTDRNDNSFGSSGN